MNSLANLLVVVGIIFAVLDFFVPTPASPNGARWRGGLLNVAIILIGVGVLIGVTAVSTK